MSRKAMIILVVLAVAPVWFVFVITPLDPISIFSKTAPPVTREPFDLNSFLNGMTPLQDGSHYVNEKTNDSVSFIRLLDEMNSAVNTVFNVLVNKNIVGVAVGMDIADALFSSDNQYFAFKTRTVCGTNCLNVDLYVVHLDRSSIKHVLIEKPDLKDINTDMTEYQYEDVLQYIESYGWNATDTIDVTLQNVGLEKGTGKFYKVSPKEVWRYDLITEENSLIETLPIPIR